MTIEYHRGAVADLDAAYRYYSRIGTTVANALNGNSEMRLIESTECHKRGRNIYKGRDSADSIHSRIGSCIWNGQPAS